MFVYGTALIYFIEFSVDLNLKIDNQKTGKLQGIQIAP